MKKNQIFIISTVLVILLVGMSACSNSSSNVKSTTNQSKPDNISQSTDGPSQSNDSSIDSAAKSDNSDDNISGSTLSENRNFRDEKKDKEKLTQYSSEEIEYARVWLQLGPNQDIDELNVQHISAGTPLNPDDETSAKYPEDVIQLAGSRLVDGVVTYSGNGDGTINVYNVPLRWDGKYPAGEKFYTNIIKNTKLVSVDTGDDEKIIKLINLLNVHH